MGSGSVRSKYHQHEESEPQGGPGQQPGGLGGIRPLFLEYARLEARVKNYHLPSCCISVSLCFEIKIVFLPQQQPGILLGRLMHGRGVGGL